MSLKMPIGRKVLDSDKCLARMMCGATLVSGAQCCRPHLVATRHLCEADCASLNEEANQERCLLGLHPCGDESLNAQSEKWANLTSRKAREQQLRLGALSKKRGPPNMSPGQLQGFFRSAKASEREINDEILAEMVEASQRSCWACEQPNAPNLRACAGCGVVKRCCKDHQVSDWKWEHKGKR